MKRSTIWISGLAILAWMLVTIAGCTSKPGASAQEDKTVASGSETKSHEHQGEGPHHGILVEWGQDEYHAEFTVDHLNRQAVVYVLDGQAQGAAAVEPDKISDVTVNLANVSPPLTLELKHDPKKSDGKGIAFTARHDQLAKIRTFTGSVSALIAGKPFAGDFQEKAHDPKESHDGMPEGVVGDRERNLYLSPGGLYTADDIKANGNTVPSEKFKGAVWAHDDDLKVGDKICPITNNKAEEQCTWVVGGKKYKFCCPPCLDKFMMWAKNNPEKVKDPDDYVKK